MIQIFKNPNYPIIKYRRMCVAISLSIILIGVAAFIKKGGFNFGIDFAGGTQLTLKFIKNPSVDRIRKLMKELNMGDVVIQAFDEKNLNEMMIRIENTGKEGDIAGHVLNYLHEKLSPGAGNLDINFIGKATVQEQLNALDPGDEAKIQETINALTAYKKDKGIITSFDEIKTLPEITPKIFGLLKDNFTLGTFSLMAADNVGPKVGKDLRSKAQGAIIWSLLGMLIYIWIRFRHFAYGLGAIIALFHDVLITLTFFILFNKEINLTVVAALLTLVGYSVNDTVVVFDRIRENLRKVRQKPLPELINQSINETLSRTIITSGTTFMTVFSLFVLGGDVIRNFAFALVVGIIVGTYSSIYIASPVVILVHEIADKRRKKKRR